MTWSRKFETPIEVEGKVLTSLRDAATFITGLPAKTAKQEHWQFAIKLLIDAAERGGIVMLAHMAMMKAINHGKPPPAKKPRRKAAKKYRLVR